MCDVLLHKNWRALESLEAAWRGIWPWHMAFRIHNWLFWRCFQPRWWIFGWKAAKERSHAFWFDVRRNSFWFVLNSLENDYCNCFRWVERRPQLQETLHILALIWTWAKLPQCHRQPCTIKFVWMRWRGAGLLCIWTSRIHGGFAFTVMIEFRSHLYGQLQYAAKSWVFALELDPDWCWLPYGSLWAISYLWSRLMNRELWLTGSGREMTMKLPRHRLNSCQAPSTK